MSNINIKLFLTKQKAFKGINYKKKNGKFL